MTKRGRVRFALPHMKADRSCGRRAPNDTAGDRTPQTLSAAEHVVEEKDTDEDLRLLFAPGSSLGGARPKASVRDQDGHLAIAKFPRQGRRIQHSPLGGCRFDTGTESRHYGAGATETAGKQRCFFCDASTVRAETAFRSFRP